MIRCSNFLILKFGPIFHDLTPVICRFVLIFISFFFVMFIKELINSIGLIQYSVFVTFYGKIDVGLISDRNCFGMYVLSFGEYLLLDVVIIV